MIHIGLFEGIGGFSLAAHWAEWETLATCEINPFGQQVLKHYWPDAYHHGDIKTLTYDTINTELSNRFGGGWRNKPVIITGGFPCQPYSLAGKRLGKEDDRHLWPEMLRVIREVSPEWVVGENVYGLVNWNGGLVFHEVQTDLEAEGYEILPVILPACAVGAPHRRERIWFVAYSNKCTTGPSRTSERTFGERGNNNDEPKEWREQTEQHNRYGNVYGVNTDPGLFGQAERQKQPMGIDQLCKKRNATDTRCSERENWLHGKEPGRKATEFGNSYTKFGAWTKFPTVEPTICSGNDGISGKLDGITFPKWRNESIKAYGNAIVPQIALQIFNAINLHAASYGWR